MTSSVTGQSAPQRAPTGASAVGPDRSAERGHAAGTAAGAAEAYRQMFAAHARERDRRAGWAAAIAAEVCAHRRPDRVIDVGCGLGFFLAAMAAPEGAGAEVTGVDADWVAGEATEIPRERYVLHDLERPFAVRGRFDLAACLEVAEHLSAARGPGLVADLTALSDWVLFSAAIPGQGGRGHINCRWQSYWADRFAERGYACYDPFRRALAAIPGMAPWFSQNLLLYVREGAEIPASLAPHRIAPQAADMVLPHFHRRMLSAKDKRFRAAVAQLKQAGLAYVSPRRPPGEPSAHAGGGPASTSEEASDA